MADIIDILFYGGTIYTLDDKNPTVEAIAVKGERIVDVGKYANVKTKASNQTQFIDLKGKTILPGLIEAHQHPILLAQNRFLYTDIGAFSNGHTSRSLTRREVEKKIRDKIKAQNRRQNPLPWCIFTGWDVEMIQDLPELSADVIDRRYSREIPIMIVAQSYHTAWVNHKMFEVCEITSPDQCPPGGEFVTDENGELTGQLHEDQAIMGIILKCPKLQSLTEEDLIRILQDQWMDYASRGYTTIAELAYYPDSLMDRCLSAISVSPDCPIRLALYIFGGTPESEIEENSKLWVAGVKFLADGSPHCGTAAIYDLYLSNEITLKLGFPSSPNKGVLNWSDEELEGMVKEFHDNGKQIAIHAHGDRAIDQSLAIYRKLMAPEDDCRHRLEHAGLITEEQIKVCAELGVQVSFFVDHLRFYGDSYTKYIFGPERTNRWTPLASAVKYLEQISIHQDNPCCPGFPLPFANMKTAVTRKCFTSDCVVYGREHCITIQEAIKAYTTGPAYQLFREDEIGSLEVGKFADLVILSNDPNKVDPAELDTAIQVDETYIGGCCVYRRI